MSRDDEFEPKLGKIHSRGGKVRSSYLRQVAQTVGVRGGRKRGRGTFHGSRIGRGAGVGRVLASRDRYATFRARRVVIKARIVKIAGRGIKAAKLHLRYLQRDGVTREGLPGDLYDETLNKADGNAFLDRCEDDRHQFRFIVSAEDASEYDDLKHFTRRLLRQMEEDLGTKLDWVAVDHYNTGHPHSHVIVRGKDNRGEDLVIAREYLSQGMRERAAELVTLHLGPRTDQEIQSRLRGEMEAESFTSLDRSLLREAAKGVVRSGADAGDPFRQSLRAGRLQKLRRLGLAEEVAPGRWRLDRELEPMLRRMGERGDIIKTMHREMARDGAARGAADYAIYDPASPDAKRLVGRVVARGLADELNDRHYLIVDGVDGRAHYVEIGSGDAIEPVREGAIVAVEPKPIAAREVDRTVAEIAAANGGRYSIDIHMQHDLTASFSFAETHVRRLEAVRRLSNAAERQPDGTWIIAPDHVERAAAHERTLAQMNPVVVETLSALPLDRQVGAAGATWLDRELVSDTPTQTRDIGFGRDVGAALAQRRQWLIEQELASEEQDRIIYRANMLGLLRWRELTHAAGQLSQELGLPYVETQLGDRIEGVYRRSLNLTSGRFALIEKSRVFTLVPWRPVLERNLGRAVAGISRGETISWTLGRPREGPSI